jgi:quercetin dioxygenase-like cupin family protein
MIRVRATVGALTAVTALAVGGGASSAQPAQVPPSETLAPLLERELPNVPGKTFTSATVTFPPAARAVPHRHGDAFVYAYVLEGTVSSQLEGRPDRVYHHGESWSEDPGAHHLSTANTSSTEPAKLLVVFIADNGQPLKTDDPPG